MYIYIYEDNSVYKSRNPPSETDRLNIEDGILQVIKIVTNDNDTYPCCGTDVIGIEADISEPCYEVELWRSDEVG